MHPDPVVIVGVCAPERHRFARLLARVDMCPVVEIATDVDVVHLDVLSRTPSAEIICVVDAVHMVEDLRSGIPLLDDAVPGDARGDVGARARQAVSFLEVSTLVCIVGWEEVETAELSLLMALASHLNPHARVRLSRGAEEDVRSIAPNQVSHPGLLERAGWVDALNDEHDPYMTDPRVSTLRYERLRPFHPERLVGALDAIDSTRAGLVLRSAGFCRLATRPRLVARWQQVGSAMWIDPLTSSMDAGLTVQDIAFTGLDLMPIALFDALDAALLTDLELSQGPGAWEKFVDTLPAWPEVVDDVEPDVR